MNKVLTKKLADAYPDFFQDLGGDPSKTCMAWGIECGDGWFELLRSLCEGIKNLGPPGHFKFSQIKEKFGGLRVYAHGGTEDIFALISAAERDSYEICETCGEKDGVTTSGKSWIKTLCPACRGASKE